MSKQFAVIFKRDSIIQYITERKTFGWLGKMSSGTITRLPYHHPLKDNSTENSPSFDLSQKTILNLLNTKCFTSLEHLKQSHALIVKTGYLQDHYVAGTLVKCYANPHFGCLACSIEVLNQVAKPNVFVWNAVIKGCLDNNEPCKILSFYHTMVADGCRPNKYTYPTLFKACTIEQAIQEGLQVHAHVVKHGLSGDVHIKSAGIQMYSSFGLVTEARNILDADGISDVICCNAMIDGYMTCGDVEAAKVFFEVMPNKNIGTWNAMVSGFAKCGMIKEAGEIFNEMPEKDDISWSAMIDGYNKRGCFKEALNIFNEMQREKVRPRNFILSSALTACANVGALDQGRWIHAYVRKNSISLDAVLGTSLLHMYAKCGRIDLAWEVFENIDQKETFSWNAMIGGLAMHGRAEDAIELSLKMLKQKVKPNEITFVAILNACAHAGWVEKGLKYFYNISQVYEIEPTEEHYCCMVDLLGRAGYLTEAEELIRSMPMRPSTAVWGAFLGGCRKHGNVEMGERVGRLLLGLEPENAGRYVLLSNIYAKAGRWDDVAKVRKLMKERGVKTTSGTSMIDLCGTIHEFKMGDGSHSQSREIYTMLEKIMERLELEGYVPNTSQVLFDIDEEEKEAALRYHSEKLAIAFGLLNTPPGSTIRIIKNLRVCEDCHSVTKLISQVYDREIIVRDRVRYHHFRRGTCSCNDFW